MTNLAPNLRYALRSAGRQPVFTAVLVATLALGIGANTAMFATIRAALAAPGGFPESDRLVFAACTFSGRLNPMASAPDFYDYRDQADQFETLAAMTSFASKTTITGGEPERAAFSVVSHDFFRMLRVAPAAGRWFVQAEGEPGSPSVAIISEALARRRFGSVPQAIDRSFVADGIPVTIVGVMPASFRFLQDVDVWFPMRRGEAWAGAPRQFHNWLIFGRLRPGSTLASAGRQVEVISRRLQEQYPESNRDKALELYPIEMAFVGRQLPRLSVLAGAVVLLLAIACANVAGMLMARGTARRGELAIRASLGATRGLIVRQLMTESLLLAAVSGLAGVGLAFWLQRLLPLAAGLTEARPAGAPDWPVLAFALGVSVLTGVLFGVAPALRAASLDPARDLAPGARATDSRGGARLRAVLVTAQVALSFVLLVTAGLLAKNLARLVSASPGFVAERLLTGEIQVPETDFPSPEARVAFFEGLRTDFAAIPGVNAVSFTSHLPMRQRYGNMPAWAADAPPASPADRQLAHTRVVLPGYFTAMGIPLLSGRDFSGVDRQGSARTIIISELMARRLFPGRNPLGRRIMTDFGKEPVEHLVIAIVGDVRLDTMSQRPPMAMYVSYPQLPVQETLRFAIRTAVPPGSITRTVRALVAKRSRNVPIEDLVSMEEVLAESLVTERVSAATLGAFSMVALLLAAIGLYGVLAFHVAQRTHEIGVRISLGADTRAVVGRILARTAVMVGSGLALGVTGALLASRVIASLLVEVTPTDPATVVGMTGVLALVALAASAIPAWRAAHVDPVRALRGE